MFVTDTVSELTQLRGHAAADARLVVSVLRGPPDVAPFAAYWHAAGSIVRGLLPANDYPHFRFADGSGLASTVTNTGWANVELAPITSWREITGADLWTWIESALPVFDTTGAPIGPLPDDTRAEIREALHAAVGDYSDGADSYRLPMHGWRVTATAG